MINKLEDLLKKAQQGDKVKLAVAAGQDKDVLEAVIRAHNLNIIEPILVGDKAQMEKIIKGLGEDTALFTIINKEDIREAALEAVSLVSTGQADFVMKGLLDTSSLLRAVLNKDVGLRGEKLLSHVMIFEIPAYNKLLLITDGGMNIEPDLQMKKEIIDNAILVSRALGNKIVKVACLSASEQVNEKISSSVHASQLKEMGMEGIFGKEVYVEGPIAFDLAISKRAARIKKFKSPVAGEADILLVASIEVGNSLGKSLTYMANAKSAGIVMGARAPIVLTSRADCAQTKLYSIALGSLVARGMD